MVRFYVICTLLLSNVALVPAHNLIDSVYIDQSMGANSSKPEFETFSVELAPACLSDIIWNSPTYVLLALLCVGARRVSSVEPHIRSMNVERLIPQMIPGMNSYNCAQKFLQLG
jgi:hypothetical protein